MLNIYWLLTNIISRLCVQRATQSVNFTFVTIVIKHLEKVGPFSKIEGGKGQDYVPRKMNWSFHNSKEMKSTLHVSRKQGIFDMNSRNLWYLKVTPKYSLVRCLVIRPLLVLRRAAKINPIKNMKRDDCPVTVTKLLPKITEDNNRITVHDEINTHFSFQGELFWKITVPDCLWNHDSREKIRPFTNHENTLYHPQHCHLQFAFYILLICGNSRLLQLIITYWRFYTLEDYYFRFPTKWKLFWTSEQRYKLWWQKSFKVAFFARDC